MSFKPTVCSVGSKQEYEILQAFGSEEPLRILICDDSPKVSGISTIPIKEITNMEISKNFNTCV
jgi:hypothetical protein